MPTFAVRPLPAPLPVSPSLPAEARTIVVDQPDSYPCRRCLRDAAEGETVVLLSYDPFVDGADTPYRQPGPIFVHAGPCAYEPSEEVPDQLTRRLLSVRSYGDDHLMLGGVVVQGAELETTVDGLLGDDAVSYLHVHNAGPGCFAARIDRLDPGR